MTGAIRGPCWSLSLELRGVTICDGDAGTRGQCFWNVWRGLILEIRTWTDGNEVIHDFLEKCDGCQ